jgi:GNAT superfamily N-acetyltransferase
MRVEPLTPDHNRSAFRSGSPALDRYIKSQAGRDSSRRLTAVFVLVLDDQKIAGYYALAPATLFLPDLLAGGERKTSRYPPMPAARLVRLTVDKRHRGRGYGRYLLADALSRVRASPVPSVAVIAEAAAEDGRGFYMREDFLPFPDQPDRFFRPMADIAALFPL